MAYKINEDLYIGNTNKQLKDLLVTVHDGYSTSTTDTYSCNYINPLTPVALYESTPGRKGNIILYDDVSNYSYIEIFYRDNDYNYNSMKFIYKTNNQNIVLSTLPVAIGDNNYIRAKSCIYSVNGNNLNFVSSADWNLSVNAGDITTTPRNGVIYIVKVLGYK